MEPLVKIKEKKSAVLIRWLGTLLSIAVMIFLLSKVGWQDALANFGEIPLLTFVLIGLLAVISRLSTFGRWHSLLKVSQTPVDAKDSLRLTFAGLFSSNVLPTTIGGDLVRLGGALRVGISSPIATASLVMDRLVGMFGMTLALPFSVSFLQKFMGTTLIENRFALAVIPSGFLSKVGKSIKKYFEQVVQSLRTWTREPGILLQALAFTLVHQTCIYLIIKLFINGMGEDLPFLTIAGIWSLTYFITLLPISINGLGLQEVTVTNLFSAFGGISIQTSISLAIFLRILWMVVSLPGAFFIGDLMAGKGIGKESLELAEEEQQPAMKQWE